MEETVNSGVGTTSENDLKKKRATMEGNEGRSGGWRVGKPENYSLYLIRQNNKFGKGNKNE